VFQFSLYLHKCLISVATVVVSFGISGFAQAQFWNGLPSDLPRDVSIDLVQAPSSNQILSGNATTGLSYTGTELPVNTGALVPIRNSYLGPTIRAWQGYNLSVHFVNQIGAPSITHWHGLDVPASMDGHPEAAIPSGSVFNYSFKVLNRAGTYWYHPHPDMATATQVYAGLAGFLIVHDRAEQKLNLPSGQFDVPLCIQDATFDSGNQRIYNPSMMPGFFGSTILVNGQANYIHSSVTKVYRLRLLNGSVSRIYKLAFSDGTPMVAIGTDGGLLDKPKTYPYIILSPGERVEVWADFRNKTVGSQITLQSLAFSSNGGQGAAVNIMKFAINRAVSGARRFAEDLTNREPYRLIDAININNPKIYAITTSGMDFLLNGGLFGMNTVAPNEIAKINTLEVISVTNTGTSMVMPHPIHFHGRQFQMLDRTVLPANLASWNTIKDGLMMTGWKDTFLIMPGETVRILVRHGNYPGKFMYHCHNLHHEDMGMMRNFRLDP